MKYTKYFFGFILVVCICLFLASCGKSKSGGDKPDIPGKVMANPQVTMGVGLSPEGLTLPTVSEIKWDFYKVAPGISLPESTAGKGKDMYECKVKMKAHYNGNTKFMAKVELLDMNGFVVTFEKLKMDGLKGETVDHSFNLYIEPELSKKITQARVVLGTF